MVAGYAYGGSVLTPVVMLSYVKLNLNAHSPLIIASRHALA